MIIIKNFNNKLSILILFLLIATISFATIDNSSAASTLYVNNNTGNDAYDGESPIFTSDLNGPKASMQNAIDTIDPDGTVNVANGTYKEHITINKNVNLIGESQTGTIIDGEQSGRVITISGNPNVNIAKFTIQNGNVSDVGGGIYDGDSVLNSVLTIINCTIQNNNANQGGGIYIFSNTTITNSTIQNNNAYEGGGIYSRGNPIISNSTIQNNTNYGIYITGMCGNEHIIIGNIFTNNQLYLRSCINSLIQNNIFENQDIRIYDTDKITVDHNNLISGTGTIYVELSPYIILTNNIGFKTEIVTVTNYLNLNCTTAAFCNFNSIGGMKFSDANTVGESHLCTLSSAPVIPSSFLVKEVSLYDLSTSTIYTGSIEVSFNYSNINYDNESNVRILHFVDGNWVDCTTRHDTANKIVYGSVNSLSPFALISKRDPDITTPTASATPKSGLYNTNKVIKLSMNENGSIYYTLNGTNPSNSSTKYTVPLTITSSATLKFIAIDDAGNPSQVYTEVYSIDKTAPKIISTYPKRYATGVSRTSTLYIKFSEKLKASVNWSKITVKNKYGKSVSISKWISGNVLYIKTNAKRTSNSYYTIYIPASALKDYSGNNFASGYTLKFKTRR